MIFYLFRLREDVSNDQDEFCASEEDQDSKLV